MELIETIMLPLAAIETNAGQVEGLPANPRLIKDDKYKKLVASIAENPEMLALRELLVYEYKKGKYVTIGGNMRREALKELKYKEAPCKVIPKTATIEQLKAYTIKDNSGFGEWDWDLLGNEWDDMPLAEWGVDMPFKASEGAMAGGAEEHNEKKEKIPEVEELLNEVMRMNAAEALAQINHSMKEGWLISGVTQGMCEAKFLRAKYYGERYPQYLSIYFIPERFMTSANEISIYEQLEKIVSGSDAGIAGLRTSTEDGNITTTTTKLGYPIGGALLPLDFPSDKACELIKEFAPKNRKPSVLDPCHGWGGRLVGALLADVASYTGIDPSEEAHRGLEKMSKAYGKYCPDTKIEIIQSPFEKVELEEQSFDIALTSPPYFDVEQYHGEQQAHLMYPNYNLWVEGFYRPLIENTYRALRSGGVFILQVGSQSYPLRQDGERIAEEVGFTIEDVRPLGGLTGSSSLHGNTDDDYENEKILILRKSK